MKVSKLEKNELISVVIPVYNVENYISKTIDTLLQQTYRNFEVLVINDGTQDNSIEIAKKVVGDDNRFVFFDKENGGLSDARNYGIERANGKYITFLDSDDYYDQYFLERMYNKIVLENAEIVLCDVALVKENYEIISHKLNKHKETISGLDALLDISILNMAQNKLYRKELFDDIKYPLGYFYEDRATTYKLFYKSHRIAFVNESLFYYLQRENSITRVLNEKKLSDPLKILKEVKLFLESKNLFNDYKKKYIQTYLLAVINSCVMIANYSDSFEDDLDSYLSSLDKQFFSLKTIHFLGEYEFKRMLALYLLFISTSLFKHLAIKQKRL